MENLYQIVDTMVDFDDYSVSKECDYKGEHYGVRDNGAVMRYQQPGKAKRKLDDVWTFGTLNAKTGYLYIGSERVHRIVATAFHGEAPSPDHVVDHIDTNRQNNRPENLRWLTKLENILNNEITRKKVEMICGSIEAFLNNPDLLFGYESMDKNFSWMRRVTKEEGKNCLDNWTNWARSSTPRTEKKDDGGNLGAWIFDNPFMNKVPIKGGGYKEMERPTTIILEPVVEPKVEDNADPEQENRNPNMLTEDCFYKSNTPNALQSWFTKTEFPCCPKEVTPDGLKEYEENLKPGLVFSSNERTTYYVEAGSISPEDKKLYVLSRNNNEEGYMWTYSVACIVVMFGKFVHVNMRMFGHEIDATKFYKSLIGEYKLTEDEHIQYWES